MLQRLVNYIVWTVCCVSLAACSGSSVKQSLGLKRNNPDEFQVVSHPPLSVPPIYHLRPPMEGEQEGVSSDERAKSLIVEGREPATSQPAQDPAYMPETAVVDVKESGVGSVGEDSLLKNAGADAAKPDIRKMLYDDAAPAAESEEEKGFLDSLKMFNSEEQPDPVVNAKGEADRLKEQKAEGKPINEGEVPVDTPAKKGFLHDIFN